MATWRCPNCATLQVDAPRCFVCNRSATSCGTCANFRRSLIGGLGYCALDRRPLTGDEQLPCWTASVEAPRDGLFDAPPVQSPPPLAGRGPRTEPVRGGRLIEIETRPFSGT